MPKKPEKITAHRKRVIRKRIEEGEHGERTWESAKKWRAKWLGLEIANLQRLEPHLTTQQIKDRGAERDSWLAVEAEFLGGVASTTRKPRSVIEPEPDLEPEVASDPEPAEDPPEQLDLILADIPPADLYRDVQWVYNHFGSSATVADAPSPGAWYLLQWARGSHQAFFKDLLPKTKPPADEDGRDRFRDCEGDLDELRRMLAK